MIFFMYTHTHTLQRERERERERERGTYILSFIYRYVDFIFYVYFLFFIFYLFFGGGILSVEVTPFLNKVRHLVHVIFQMQHGRESPLLMELLSI